MHIAAHSPDYLPHHASGGERTLHAYLKALQEKGHEVRTIVYKAYQNYEYDSVECFSRKSMREVYEWADIAISHLGALGECINMCRTYDVPMVYYLHNSIMNDSMVRYKGPNGEQAVDWIGLIYNTEWVRKELNHPHKSEVCWPLIGDFKKIQPGNKVVMINLNQNKGAKVFYWLAEMFPEVEFLGVKGYGKQILRDLPNVEIVENTPDIKAIYSQAKVVLMPSVYESFGMVAAECMMQGIPLIASDTPGLKECLGEYPTYPVEIQAWHKLLSRLLNDGGYYEKMRNFAIQRGKKIRIIQKTHVENFEKFLIEHHESYCNQKDQHG